MGGGRGVEGSWQRLFSLSNKLCPMESGSGLPADICLLVILMAIRLSVPSIQKLVLYVVLIKRIIHFTGIDLSLF